MIVDAFAGPGGWDAAARELGLDVLGIEWDDAACATRKAAGLRTLQGDVAALNPEDFEGVEGFIASAPCQAWSMAGNGGGQEDKALVYRALHDLEQGKDTRAELRARCVDDRSMLVVEPLRWILALEPPWVALEQVPPVLELWQEYAAILRGKGYRVWTGILSAERYGVPQTRRRAILMAHRDRYPMPPQATHQAYVPGEPARHEHTLEGELLPWVSMAAALGWDEGSAAYRLARGEGMLERHGERRDHPDEEPAPAITSKARTANWTLRTGMNSMKHSRDSQDMVPYERAVDQPAPTVDGKVGSAWKVAADGGHEEPPHRWKDDPPTHYDQRQTGATPRPVDEPAPTMLSEGLKKGVPVWMRANKQENAAVRCEDEPAPTITGGHDTGDRVWTHERPVTTVQGDPRIAQPGHKGDVKTEPDAIRQMEGAVRVTEQEAAILQGFPPDYPFQGSRTKRFEQIGNAVPPPLARAILSELVGAEQVSEEAA